LPDGRLRQHPAKQAVKPAVMAQYERIIKQYQIQHKQQITDVKRFNVFKNYFS